MTKARTQHGGGVVKVVLAYAVFAGLWILLSDWLAGLFFSDHEALVRVAMLKGLFFTVVTSLLLYGLVKRLTGALVAAHERELTLERERQKPPPMLVAMVEVSENAIFVKDEEGRYLLVNPVAARMIGKPADEVIGRDDHALHPPEVAARLVEIHRRVRATGQSETTEELFQTATGERLLLVTRGPLRGADGKVFGTYGFTRDITDSKRAERDLKELADDLSATLQAIPDLMFELDAQGRYHKVKALNDVLLAAPPAEIVGRTVGEVLPAEAAATCMRALAGAAQRGTDFGRTITLSLPSGEHHFELSVARKPVPAGHGERFIVLSRDITARHAAEAALRQRNEELERFNRAAIERELRMVALKREVNELAAAAGRPAPYDTRLADAGGAPATT